MPLHFLLPLVVAGIAGIALLTHLLGLSRERVLRDADQACEAWTREYPDDPACFATLSADGHAAIVEFAGGTGLVWVMGADTVARPLFDAIVTPSSDGLTVQFPEIAAPQVKIRIDESCDIDAWRGLLTSRPKVLPA